MLSHTAPAVSVNRSGRDGYAGVMKSFLNGFAGQEARRHRQPCLYARVTPVVLCFLLMVATQSKAEPLTTLDALRWERRVLLVYVDDDDATRGREDARTRAGGSARDGHGQEGERIRENVLAALDLDALFTLIDGMPTRRREVGARNAERSGGRH